MNRLAYGEVAFLPYDVTAVPIVNPLSVHG